jgi:hypothetical protein
MPAKKEEMWVCDECAPGRCTANHPDEECLFDNKPKWKKVGGKWR